MENDIEAAAKTLVFMKNQKYNVSKEEESDADVIYIDATKLAEKQRCQMQQLQVYYDQQQLANAFYMNVCRLWQQHRLYGKMLLPAAH